MKYAHGSSVALLVNLTTLSDVTIPAGTVGIVTSGSVWNKRSWYVVNFPKFGSAVVPENKLG